MTNKKYRICKKRWVGTVICQKCSRKGREYIVTRTNISTGHKDYYLYVQHFKRGSKKGEKVYDSTCYYGSCDEDGNKKIK